MYKYQSAVLFIKEESQEVQTRILSCCRQTLGHSLLRCSFYIGALPIAVFHDNITQRHVLHFTTFVYMLESSIVFATHFCFPRFVANSIMFFLRLQHSVSQDVVVLFPKFAPADETGSSCFESGKSINSSFKKVSKF